MRRWLLLAALAAACTRSPAPAGPAPASFLLVTIDTLRADRLGCYGDREALTPRLDALAREGVVFDAAFSHSPLTLPSHATLFTGLLPPAHGVRGNGTFALAPSVPTLAEQLKARGRPAAAFVGGFPLSRRFGLARGFDDYDDALDRAPGVHFEFAERRGAAVAAAARTWLLAHRGPVFVWVHLFDPHAPYDPPPEFRGRDPYRGEVAAADAALGALLDVWDARPEESVVVVSADHGEAFGEHGEESHSLFVYDTTLRVPLIVRARGIAPRRVAEPVGLVDVAATLLDLSGSPPTLPGTSLRPLLEGRPFPARPLYAETLAPRLDFGWSDLRSLRDGGLKYIRAPRPELYDVAADPGEARDLAAARPRDVARLEAALARLLDSAGEKETRRALEPDAAERLRALGYVQGPQGAGSGADPKDKVEVARRIAAAAGPFPNEAAAAAAYRDLARIDPENPLVNLRLADALLRSGRSAEAIGLFRKVVATRPRSPDPYVGLATALAQGGHLDEAETALHQALEVAPGHGAAHYNLGEIARARGDLRAARQAYEAARADPATRARAEARIQSLESTPNR
jgi:arylsulfatase A-like enzyme